MTDKRDVFNDNIVKTSTNDSNLAGHYPYSPERWRLFKGSNETGNRLFPEYDTVSEYNHAGDYHELKPAAGETIIFESAERYRYTVQYEIEMTWAVAINQQLQGDDYFRVGFYDGTDGWFLEHNATHESNEVDIVLLRAGNDQYRETNTVPKGGFQSNTRIGLETAWYDVTRQQWTQSFSNAGSQTNDSIGQASADDVRGPQKGNLNLRYEVQADAQTSNLILEAGSCAIVTKGGGEDNVRTKAVYFEDTIADTGTWSPIRAFREIPEKAVINNQLLATDLLSYGTSTPVEIVILSFDETNVTFDGTDSWGTPPVWQEQNNSLETRNDVNTFANSAGTLVSTANDPGGFQIGFGTLIPTSGQNFNKGVSEVQIGAKRNLPNGDIALILGRADSSDTLGYATSWEQDW